MTVDGVIDMSEITGTELGKCEKTMEREDNRKLIGYWTREYTTSQKFKSTPEYSENKEITQVSMNNCY